MVETLKVFAANIVAATGFTIYGFNASQLNEPLEELSPGRFGPAAGIVRGYVKPSVGGVGTRLWGQWTIAWAWN